MTEVEKMYSPNEVMGLLGFKERTVRTWIAKGRLKTVKVGKRAIRIPESALREFLADSVRAA